MLQAVILGLVPLTSVHEEVYRNLPILFLVLFVVTAVNFLKDLLALVFMKAVLFFRSEILLALFFNIMPAILSALLDALTVAAVLITVLLSLFLVFHRFASERVSMKTMTVLTMFRSMLNIEQNWKCSGAHCVVS